MKYLRLFGIVAFLLACFVPNTFAWIFGGSVAKPACGGTSSSKETQLLTPAYPPRECTYTIKATSSHVCQLRIDFAMTLAQPSLPSSSNQLNYPQCIDDYFEVNGLRLCGLETNQHIYVPLNRTAGVTHVNLKFVIAHRLGTVGLPTPNWNFRVTQLECPSGASVRMLTEESPIQPEPRTSSIKDGFYVAPPGCLQYFPYATGIITSFNYDKSNGIYPGNLNYAICFRRNTYTDTVQLKALVFVLGAEANPSNLLETDNFCYPTMRTEDRSEDYLMIPQSTVLENHVRATYFCGKSAQGVTIKSTHPGPLMMVFNSDGIYRQQREKGFYFKYTVS